MRERARSRRGSCHSIFTTRCSTELGKYLFQVQIFGNGEPTLDWPRTREIIARAHKRRIFTLMSTNCTLITPEIAEEISASR